MREKFGKPRITYLTVRLSYVKMMPGEKKDQGRKIGDEKGLGTGGEIQTLVGRDQNKPDIGESGKVDTSIVFCGQRKERKKKETRKKTSRSERRGKGKQIGGKNKRLFT